MIRTLSQLVRRRRAAVGDPEAGVSLAEVLVAMFVFSLVSMGLLHGMISAMSVNRDARARQVAANLAAAEIDRVRELPDVFAILDEDQTVGVGPTGTDDAAVDGDEDGFRVRRTTSWVSDPGTDFDCGTGTGELRYKQVSVEVTWDGMRPGTDPVRSDTVLDPKERINDPTKGTLLVEVLDAKGAGQPGITVTAQALDGSNNPVGAALPAVATDAQGCAYILKVPVGASGTNYRVTINKAGYVNTKLQSTPSTVVGVQKGAAGSAAFEYDRAAEVTVRYATNSGSRPVFVPLSTSMPTTFASTTAYASLTGTSPTTPTGSSYATQRFTVYPFASGYDVLAGTETASPTVAETCRSADPAAWPSGVREARASVEPGGSATVEVPMGVVAINAPNIGSGSNRYVKAVRVNPPSGVDDPGCGLGDTYMFSNVLNSNGDGTIALPYGSWRLYRGGSTAAAATTAITAGQVTAVSDAAVNDPPLGQLFGDVVVLDPRITP